MPSTIVLSTFRVVRCEYAWHDRGNTYWLVLQFFAKRGIDAVHRMFGGAIDARFALRAATEEMLMMLPCDDVERIALIAA